MKLEPQRNRLNIALVTPEFVSENTFDGGLANYMFRLAKSLQELGHKPVVFVCSGTDEKILFDGLEVYRVNIGHYDEWLYSHKLLSKPYTFIKRLINNNTKLWRKVEAKYRVREKSLYLNQKIREVNKSVPFDIIHYSNLSSVGFHRPENIPAIARISGNNAIWFKYGGYGETPDDIRRIDNLEMKTLRKMDALFGPCRFISDMVEKKAGRKISLIESMFSNEVVTPDDSVYNEKLKGKKYLLFFGTISQVKGIGTLSEVIYELLEKNPDLHFVLVGKSTHSKIPGVSMIDYLIDQSREHKNRILHINKLAHSQLFPILSNTEFVVLPSDIDNFPNTCIEAMAHGKIVIGSNGNGFDQLITHKQSGFLFPVRDSKKLLQCMEEALRLNPEEKRSMEMKAKERTEQLHPKYIVPQVIQFYEATIKKHKRS